MRIEFISKLDARRQTAETLTKFVKSNKEKIDKLMAREAKGMAKLEKSLKKDEAVGALPDLAKDMGIGAPPPVVNLCLGCGGDNVEPIGNHLGINHFMCRDCGEVGATVKEQNEQADQNQAQNALEAMAQKSLEPMMGKSETNPGRTASQQAGIERQILAGAANSSPGTKKIAGGALRGEKMADSFAPGASQKHGVNAYKSEPSMTAKPVCKPVESIRQAAGLMGGTTPKAPMPKAPTVPITSAVAPQKDAFNTGGMNPTTAAAMGKSEASDYAADRRDTMKDVQKIVNKPKIETTPKRTAEATKVSQKLDASLRGEADPDSFTAKAEKDPSKKPFNTGAGHGGVPSKEVPNQDVAVESARSGTEPPPEEGGKEVKAPGSGGQIKKTNLKKDEMASVTPLAKVSDIRARAAAKHAAKRQQVASDVKAISAVQKAVSPSPVQKAEGIPQAPTAPGAKSTSAPAKLPSSSPAKASSPQPPKL